MIDNSYYVCAWGRALRRFATEQEAQAYLAANPIVTVDQYIQRGYPDPPSSRAMASSLRAILRQADEDLADRWIAQLCREHGVDHLWDLDLEQLQVIKRRFWHLDDERLLISYLEGQLGERGCAGLEVVSGGPGTLAGEVAP